MVVIAVLDGLLHVSAMFVVVLGSAVWVPSGEIFVCTGRRVVLGVSKSVVSVFPRVGVGCLCICGCSHCGVLNFL